MNKIRIWAVILIIFGIFLGYFVYATQKGHTLGDFPFRYGLDLSGGIHLVYQADVSSIPASEIQDSMESLRDVIEKRVNIFGVSEPVVQTEQGSLNGKPIYELVVDLPGLTNLNQAIATIKATPTLEFRIMNPNAQAIMAAATTTVNASALFGPALLTGKDLQNAQVIFDPSTGLPQVSLTFNSEGAKKFADITTNNVGKVLAILLDGSPLSTPVIKESITDGTAVINGNFTAEQAQTLVRNLKLRSASFANFSYRQPVNRRILGRWRIVGKRQSGNYKLHYYRHISYPLVQITGVNCRVGFDNLYSA